MVEHRDRTEAEGRATRLRWDGWVMAVVLPPVAMGTVVAVLWYDAFMRDPDDRSLVAAAVWLGVFWCVVFACVDWPRHRNRAAVMLSIPLIVAGVAAGLGIHHLALDYRGEVAACEVLDSEVSWVDSRGTGGYWKAAYELDCDGHDVRISEELEGGAPPEEPVYRFEPGCCADTTASMRVVYDPSGMVPARKAGEGGDWWPWMSAALIFFGIGVTLRLVVRPGKRT